MCAGWVVPFGNRAGWFPLVPDRDLPKGAAKTKRNWCEGAANQTGRTCAAIAAPASARRFNRVGGFMLNILEIIMAIIAKAVLSARIAGLRKAKEALRADVQEILVGVAYQACLGNANWANELLEAARDTINIKPLTMWLETFAPLVVRQDKFAINKGARKAMGVENELDFAEYEVEMRKANWWEMTPPQKATSIFAPDEYIDGAFERMVKNLNKEGCPDLANAVKALLPELYSSDAWRKMREDKDAVESLPTAPM